MTRVRKPGGQSTGITSPQGVTAAPGADVDNMGVTVT